MGALCDITLGELAACELAIREHPCAYAGIGLDECLALDACDAVVRQRAEELVLRCSRVDCGGRG